MRYHFSTCLCVGSSGPTQRACPGSSRLPPHLMFPHHHPCSDSALCCLVCGESLSSENWTVSQQLCVPYVTPSVFLERKTRHKPTERLSMPFRTPCISLSTAGWRRVSVHFLGVKPAHRRVCRAEGRLENFQVSI